MVLFYYFIIIGVIFYFGCFCNRRRATAFVLANLVSRCFTPGQPVRLYQGDCAGEHRNGTCGGSGVGGLEEGYGGWGWRCVFWLVPSVVVLVR